MIKKVNAVVECVECASKNIIIKKKKNEVLCKDCGAIFEPLTPKEEEKLEHARGFGFTKHIVVRGLFAPARAAKKLHRHLKKRRQLRKAAKKKKQKKVKKRTARKPKLGPVRRKKK